MSTPIYCNVIQGDALEFDSILYPQQNHNTLQYIQNTLTQLPTTLMDAGKNLFQSAYNKFLQVTSAESMMRARNAILSATNMRQENIIYPIKTTVDSQTASLTMQRWIMAEPTVRELYHDQRCDGFSDTYVDMEPGKVGEEHYDWRRVMSGVVRYDDDTVVAKFYMDDLREGDRELDSWEKISIVGSWEVLKIAVSQMNEDPTSVFGDKL